ncbi:MAG: BamA/TamA family outer membrane protein [Bacteroidales bacterium]|jgi:outer membrane protein insertion porin family|nr:BamA/TamA family outer membrane protein [Bacteroidales bacterium]
MRRKKYLLLLLFLLTLIPASLISQTIIGDVISLDYNKPKTYEIGGVTVSGVKYLDKNVLIMISGLTVGDQISIPGDAITKSVNKLWDQGLFDDVKIYATNVQGNKIFLEIYLQERPRLSKFRINGLKKSDVDNLRDEIKLTRGDVVTENLLMRTKNIITRYFTKKGFLAVEVDITEEPDTTRRNEVTLAIDVKKNKKVKIQEINVHGNEQFTATRVRSLLKNTKEKGSFKVINYSDSLVAGILRGTFKLSPYEVFDNVVKWGENYANPRIFKSSKYVESDYSEDKMKLLGKYNEMGFRDAQIVKDSVYLVDNHNIGIDIYLDEGLQYYFGDLNWVGNTKYSDEQLNSILRIEKGEVYNRSNMETNLFFNPNGFDVSSLYMDDGYLFFNVQPVEVRVEGDTIDMELRVYEGIQARISKVGVKGNNRTNDYVILREIRSKPGQLFNRSAIIRTQRELAQMQYFNPEKLGLDYNPNPADGSVDLTFLVEEASADQIELSGGWGYGRIIGTLSLRLANFSIKNFFKKEAWHPFPSGDGQQLTISFQTYGRGYWSAGFSFIEPWLGGKKANALTLVYYYSQYSNADRIKKYDPLYFSVRNHRTEVGITHRLKWPDDFFSIYTGVGLEFYNLQNFSAMFPVGSGTGNFYNFNLNLALRRNSTDNWIYPRSGSDITLGLKLTPPWSLLGNKDYQSSDESEKYRWIEYHKWKLNAAFYQRIVGDLVLSAKIRFGFLGYYNSDIGATYFERYFLGGDGLSGYNNYDGREIVSMRGYTNNSITAEYSYNTDIGGTIYDRFSIELRYPITLNPSATIYALGFIEAGNCWDNFKTFNPFNTYKSAGLGLRFYLPIFGMLGLDWGYGFDEVPGKPSAHGGHFHFSINNSID